MSDDAAIGEERPRPPLARSALTISAATAISRITGFLRVLAVAAAMGTTFLANTYQTANTAPNLIFELIAAGVLTSVFVPTFIEYLVRGEREEGWHAANVLTTVSLAALIGLSLVLALVAPLIMRILTLGVSDEALRGDEIALGTRWLRLFAPQIAFYGIGMIMTGALHAYRRFAMPAIAPIFNNVVVIVVYLVYAGMRGDRPPTVTGITDGEVFLLGAGTTLGVVAMTLCLIPSLRRLGWRFRPTFQPRHPAVRKAARVGGWALGYAGGYQAGLILVLVLANRVEGGVAAYQWAFTFFFVPHALIAAPIFHVLFPEMSERAAEGRSEVLMEKLREGLRMLTFILVPVAAWMAAAAGPLSVVTLEYGDMTEAGADLVGRVIAAFALGLPTYSAFLVITRAFYALSDARTPTLVNAAVMGVSGALGAALFFALPDDWAVAGLALGHSVGFAAGSFVMIRLLSRRTSRVGSTALAASISRAVVVGGLAFIAMGLLALRSSDSKMQAVVELAVTAAVGAAVYLGVMARMRAPELRSVLRLVRR